MEGIDRTLPTDHCRLMRLLLAVMFGAEAFLAEVMKDMDPDPTMQDLEGVENGSLQVFFSPLPFALSLYQLLFALSLCHLLFLHQKAMYEVCSTEPHAGRRCVASVQRQVSRPLSLIKLNLMYMIIRVRPCLLVPSTNEK